MSGELSWETVPRLVDQLLDEQRTLRAVDEFSRSGLAGRDSGRPVDNGPGSAADLSATRRFETLIPVTEPGRGEQYAFSVDLDACTGCKACVTACHSLNGLEEGESWRRVGLVESGPSTVPESAIQQTVTTACHHCESPACLEGCPVRAYDKDPVTGIVRHLDDQCIGCRYCQLMCPYDVPKYSQRLGIVRKCDMCQGRLRSGEAPACVQGCPNGAISIEIVGQGRTRAEEEMLLPLAIGGMPSSSLTRPTTRYRTRRESTAGLVAADACVLSPSDGHPPLASMLILTQAGVGALVIDALLAIGLSGAHPAARVVTLGLALLLTGVGLAASTLHLGRPQWAFRAVLGLRTSWMSREIVAFGLFVPALAAAFLATAAGTSLGAIEHGMLTAVASFDAPLRSLALAFGLAGLLCSMQIYAATGRPLWRLDRTAVRFGLSALGLGAIAGALAWSLVAMLPSEVSPGVAASSAFGATAIDGTALALGLLLLGGSLLALKLCLERSWLVRSDSPGEESALERTRELLRASLAKTDGWRRRLGWIGVLVSPAAYVALIALDIGGGWLVLAAAAGLVSCGSGELLERGLFFRGEAMAAMPGGRRTSARHPAEEE